MTVGGFTGEQNEAPHAEDPIVTVVLYAHNEERFIREAVASMFAQTYSPLEIVLSDDGSTDQTLHIMEEMAAGYSGPHKVILNQNVLKTGIGSQINAAWTKGTGILIVLANGDDVSLPHRVERIVEVWIASQGRASAIASAFEIMDADGTRTGRVVLAEHDFSNFEESTYRRFGGPGATSLCVSRECFDRFGPLAPNLILEDGPMNLRSTLTGEWRFIPEPLVLYRVHEDNISQAFHLADFETWRTRHRAKAVWQMREGEKAFVQMLSDLYSQGADTRDSVTIGRARINAARRLLESQLLASYYSDDWAFSLGRWFRMAWAMGLTSMKLAAKRVFPSIELRNDRWHYRSVVSAAGQSTDSAKGQERG